MYYYYNVRLCYSKNNYKIIKDYKVSYIDLIDFLNEKKKKNSTMVIFRISPYLGRRFS